MGRILTYKRIDCTLAISLICFFILPAFLPLPHLTFFAPFLVIVYYKRSLLVSLWWSFFCGLLVDLLAASTPIGFYALTYCLTTALLYAQRRHFFADNLSTLPLLTFFFAILSTLFHLILMYVFEQPIKITPLWLMTDLILMPAGDAFYALVVFLLPSLLFGKAPRKGKDYFLQKS